MDGRMLVWYWGRRGGGARYTLELTRALADLDGPGIHLTTSRQADLAPAYEELGLPGFTVDTYTDMRSALRSLPGLPALARRMRRHIEENGIRTVLCTMPHLYNPFMLGAIRAAGARYLVTVHDTLLRPGGHHPAQQWLLDREVRRADGIVVLTRHVASVLTGKLGIDPERIAVAPHGPFTSLVPEAEPTPAAPSRLLFFGRILPYKGLDLLLDAFDLLRARRPDLTLAIRGHGDAGPLAGRIAGTPGVEFDNRYIPDPDVPCVLGAADLVVLPYRQASQSGVVALAQPAGLPVVTTPVGGLAEQIRHEETGLVAGAATAPALAEAIERLLEDRDLYRRCAANIRRSGDGAWSRAAERIAGLALRPARA